MPLLGYNNCSQITETGFAEQNGVCTDSFENLSENSLNLKGDQSNDTNFNPPLFSLVNTFKLVKMVYAPLVRLYH